MILWEVRLSATVYCQGHQVKCTPYFPLFALLMRIYIAGVDGAESGEGPADVNQGAPPESAPAAQANEIVDLDSNSDVE